MTMERDYGVAARDADDETTHGDASAETSRANPSVETRYISRDKADELMDRILAERADVFRRLAQ